jgi:hypothetical protein
MKEQMSLPVVDTVPFHYSWWADSTYSGAACGGQTGVRLVKINCFQRLLNEPSQHTRPYQIGFRSTLFHEYGHVVANSLASDGSVPAAGYYGFESLYDEAFSQISEIVLSQFESVDRGVESFGPDRKWPMVGVDDANGVYSRALSFVSLFFDMFMYLGYRATKVVYPSRDGTQDDTIMVGNCLGVTPAEYDWHQCPANSYLTNSILKAKATMLDGGYPVYEVSKAFANHIADAVPYVLEPGCVFCHVGDPSCVDCPSPFCVPDDNNPTRCPQDCCDKAIGGPKELTPPFDDVTNIRRLAPPLAQFIPISVTPTYASYPAVNYTPDPFPSATGKKKTSLYSYLDNDIFAFVGLKGITYSFIAIPSGSRTCLRVRNSIGSILASSPSCSDVSLTSASLTYTPTTNGVFFLAVSANVAYPVSSSNYYSLFSYIVSGDEYGDERASAVPAIADFWFGYAQRMPGYIDDSSDTDYFYVDLYDESLISFSLESSSLGTALLEDASGNPLSLAWNDGVLSSSVFPAGRYYFKINGTGNQFYYLKVGVTGAVASSTDLNFPTTIVSNNVVTLPGPVSTMGSYRGQFFSADEEHYFKISATDGKIIQVFTHNLQTASTGNPAVDTVLELYVPDQGFYKQGAVDRLDGEILLRDDDGGAFDDFASRIQFVVPVSGEYILKVRQPNSEKEPAKGDAAGIGRYMLSVSVGGSDYASSIPRFPGE